MVVVAETGEGGEEGEVVMVGFVVTGEGSVVTGEGFVEEEGEVSLIFQLVMETGPVLMSRKYFK